MAWVSVITNGGRTLLNRWSTGGNKLVVDTPKCGAGVVEETDMRDQTDVSNETGEAVIAGIKEIDSGTQYMIQVTAVSDGYTLKQIGLFAHIQGDEDETLLALMQNTSGIEIPAVSVMPDFVYTLYSVISMGDGDLDVSIDTSALVSLGQMEEAIEEAAEGKVDKAEGMGLSHYDYDAVEKLKVTKSIQPDFWKNKHIANLTALNAAATEIMSGLGAYRIRTGVITMDAAITIGEYTLPSRMYRMTVFNDAMARGELLDLTNGKTYFMWLNGPTGAGMEYTISIDGSRMIDTDIVNNLTSTDIRKPLSAAQGKALSDAIATKFNGINITPQIPSATDTVRDIIERSVTDLANRNVPDGIYTYSSSWPSHSGGFSLAIFKSPYAGGVKKLTGTFWSVGDSQTYTFAGYIDIDGTIAISYLQKLAPYTSIDGSATRNATNTTGGNVYYNKMGTHVLVEGWVTLSNTYDSNSNNIVVSGLPVAQRNATIPFFDQNGKVMGALYIEGNTSNIIVSSYGSSAHRGHVINFCGSYFSKE